MDAKLLCLAALSNGNLSGYEIRKFFEEGYFSYFQRVTYGSIYPALKKLLAEGLILEQETDISQRQDKRLYQISPSGRQHLIKQLLDPPAPDFFRSDVMTTFIYGALIPAEKLQLFYDDYISYTQKQLEQVSEKFNHQTCPKTDNPALSLIVEMGMTLFETKLSFLQQHRDTFLQQMEQHRIKLSLQSKGPRD